MEESFAGAPDRKEEVEHLSRLPPPRVVVFLKAAEKEEATMRIGSPVVGVGWVVEDGPAGQQRFNVSLVRPRRPGPVAVEHQPHRPACLWPFSLFKNRDQLRLRRLR